MKNYLIFLFIFILCSCGKEHKEKDQLQEITNTINSISDKELEDLLLSETKKIADLSKVISEKDAFRMDQNTSIEDAEFIFIGESHMTYSNSLKNMAFLNKHLRRGGKEQSLTNKGIDLLLLEGSGYYLESRSENKLISHHLASYLYSQHGWHYVPHESAVLVYKIMKRINYAFRKAIIPKKTFKRSERGQALFKLIKNNGYRIISNAWATGWDIPESYDSILRNRKMVEILKESKDKKARGSWKETSCGFSRFIIIAGAWHIPLYENFIYGKPNETIDIYDFLKNEKSIQLVDKDLF